MSTVVEAKNKLIQILERSEKLKSKQLCEIEAEQILLAKLKGHFEEPLDRFHVFLLKQKDKVSASVMSEAIQVAEKRTAGFTLQYLLGTQVFLDHEYEVNSSTLVPRPETEILLVEATQCLKSTAEEPRLGMEIGIGSGILSLELLDVFSDLKMVASEISEDAISLSRRNEKRILNLKNSYDSRLHILQAFDDSEVFEPFEMRGFGFTEKFDFLISNPPYVALEDEIDQDVKENEPKKALYSPDGQGMHFYEKIAKEAKYYLKNSAPIFLEIPHERAEKIALLFEECGYQTKIHLDLNQRPRVLIASQNG